MIDKETASQGMNLISTAIGELMEDAAAEALRVNQNGWSSMVLKADKLKAVGSDVAGLAEAMAILARRADR